MSLFDVFRNRKKIPAPWEKYYTKEDAEDMVKEQQFNPILWLFFGIYGEWRWLQNGHYGDVYYSTFDSKMIKPLKSLMN